MQENQNYIKTVTDQELARRYGTDNIAVEINEIDFAVEVKKFEFGCPRLLVLKIEDLKAKAQGRGLYLTIAVIGLATLISAITKLIN